MNLNNINISDRKQKEMLNKVEDFVDTVSRRGHIILLKLLFFFNILIHLTTKRLLNTVKTICRT